MIHLLNYALLKQLLCDAGSDIFSDAIDGLLDKGLDASRYGDIPRWQVALETLPDLQVLSSDLANDVVSINVGQLSSESVTLLTETLFQLHPWRKGPFSIADVYIDTEWRSDFKWNRLSNHIDSLKGRRVLDVGCGSGYHCWRMAGEGAALTVGIDPTPLFVFQYWVLQKYLQNPAVWVLPARMEELPKNLELFDTVFSMGVLYHRRSPFDHLLELREALVEGGQLVLETLVIEGRESEVLVPEGRYSKMGNVWFIPSVATLCSWLVKMKFKDVAVVDVSVTTYQEQRSTKWMNFHSLSDFLDPDDISKTVEGYPSPCRAIVTARK